MTRHLLPALVAVLWLTAMARDRMELWVGQTELPVLVQETSVEVRDRHGDLLRPYLISDGRWRMAVTSDAVDAGFIAMLIAYEDKRFASHHGVDPMAVLRAGWQMLRHGGVVSGGSTLTMQVARLLEESGTGRWQGKLRQMRVAMALERRLTKDQILTLYLHLAPYGGNVEGVRAASLAYFGKEPTRLTPAEAAFLVALPQSPEARRPDRHPEAARIARDRVLDRLASVGALPKEAARAAKMDRPPTGRIAFPQWAPHLSDRLQAHGVGRIDLTLDRALQQSLEQLAHDRMQARDARMSLAILVADHTTGEVLASVGSPEYSETAGRPGFVDMTEAVRSPGSTLKPLVYGLAFDRGLAHPETLIEDRPVQFGRYAPQNFDGRFRGDVRVSKALQLSLNIPVVRLLEGVGPAHLMKALRQSGAAPQLPGGQPGLAVALGGVGLSLRDLVQTYAMLGQLGQARPLVWQLGQSSEASGQVLTPRSAWQIGQILAGLAPPPNAGPAGRVAYKTGTSYGHRDAWAVGYDGQYVVGVWMGRPDGTPVPGAFGGDLAAPILFEALGRVRSVAVPLPPPPADTLILSNARLPKHLQRFGSAVEAPQNALSVVFPPNGARLAVMKDGVPLKLRNGVPPFTVLANGRVVASGLRRAEALIPSLTQGFSTLSVIDARGQSDRVQIELR